MKFKMFILVIIFFLLFGCKADSFMNASTLTPPSGFPVFEEKGMFLVSINVGDQNFLSKFNSSGKLIWYTDRQNNNSNNLKKWQSFHKTQTNGIHQRGGCEQPGDDPLCLLQAVVAVAGGADFEADGVLAVPVVAEVDFRVHRVEGLAGLADAQGDVAAVAPLADADLIACVQVVHQVHDVRELLAGLRGVLHGCVLLSIPERAQCVDGVLCFLKAGQLIPAPVEGGDVSVAVLPAQPQLADAAFVDSKDTGLLVVLNLEPERADVPGRPVPAVLGDDGFHGVPPRFHSVRLPATGLCPVSALCHRALVRRADSKAVPPLVCLRRVRKPGGWWRSRFARRRCRACASSGVRGRS